MRDPDSPRGQRLDSLRERKKLATRIAIHEVALRLVTDRGPEGVTIEEICAEVGVSARTFFNYYPTKLAAAFDLAETRITEEDRARFLAGSGNLISELCELVATSVSLPRDYSRVKRLVQSQPELANDFWQQLNLRKQPFIEIVQARTNDPNLAANAFGLVLIGVSSIMRQHGETDLASITERLRAEVLGLAELILDGSTD
jgi:AcrR family transcriptional regulator